MSNYETECQLICDSLTVPLIKRLEDKDIFLTGASGFIGKWFIRFFNHINDCVLDKPCRVLCTEHSTPVNETEHVRTVKLNLKDPNCLLGFEGPKFNFIIHAAGISDPREYSRMPLETLDLSYMGTRNILEFAKKHNPESILCFSSSAIYGNVSVEDIPTKEEYVGKLSPFSDRSSYMVGKQVMETLAHIYHSKYNLPVKIVRPFNIYGPDMSTGVIPIFIDKVMTKQVITIYGDGQQTRAFCSIYAAMQGFIRVLLDGKDGCAYNIGSENSEVSMIELATVLSGLYKQEPNIELVAYPEGYPVAEPRRSCPDMNKITQDLNFKDTNNLKEGLYLLLKSKNKILSPNKNGEKHD